jgi:hypothetical protein
MLAVLALSFGVGCATPTATDLDGLWGGQHVNLTLADTGGAIEFDCGRGSIAPGWTLTREGRFTATGALYSEAGPEPIEGRPALPARYEGLLRNARLTLTVSLTDSGTRLGPFTLERGRTVQLIKCR